MRDGAVLAVTSVLAIAAPALAARHLRTRVHALAPKLTELTGEPSRIGDVEAGLTGTVRLTDVVIGDLLRVDAIEASVALDSLLAGDLGADEVRLERPRLRARVYDSGDSNLARMMRRVAEKRAGAGGGGSSSKRLRRIVVTEGDLVLEVVGVGRVEARGVELHPQTGGVRVVTGAVRARAGVGPFATTFAFARGGGDLTLPDARLRRFLAVGGDVSAATEGAPALTVHGAALGWQVWGAGVLALRGDVDDHGVPRPFTATAMPGGAFDLRGRDLPLAFLGALAPPGVELADAHGTGGATVIRTPLGWHATADADVGGVIVDHGAVSDRPFGFDGAVAVEIERAGDVIEIASLRASRGAVTLHGRGRVRRGGPAGIAAGELDLALAEAPCLDAIAAIPPELRGPVGALALDGTIGGELHITADLDAEPGEGVVLGVDLANRCTVLGDPPEADVHALAGVADHTFPDGSRAPVGPGVGDWIALTALPAYVDGAFVAAEDARFHQHHGVDLVQVERSLEVDLREGRFARGGSTISQQLVKNAFLTSRRTLDRKLQEVVLTWRLEAALSKRQILERYLNVIELGPGVFGIAAAARHWFGKSASDLSVAEAALLAAMTPEPKSMSRRLAAAGGLDPQSAERLATVLRHMERAGLISDAQRSRAARETLEFRADALEAGTRISAL